ncbi:HEAT repeat-containing protein 3-like [Centruroides sculpturatus]|uniref:HEAT repeat-containing protein 3-like n=1 Tax=Centruroides sculpturatus TaxID=218467 RepID=UPI000C6EDD74|nr:HEAT repeat-containing protein 3-like [Centruroides sculpturatus]
MGKTKQRRKTHRNRPTGLPSVKEAETDELLEESPSKYQTLIEKLQSGNREDKECAACTIASLVNRPEAVESLLQANIVKIAGPLLLDPNHVVRYTTAGALRNLSVGGHDVCREMIRQDVMTPTVALLRQYYRQWLPAKSTESKIDSEKETFCEAVNLLWNLCESSEIAVDIITKEQLLPILVSCLDVKNFDVKVCVTVSQCLNTISEDNSEVIEALRKPEILETIHSLVSLPQNDSPWLLLRALASSLMLNIYSDTFGNCPPVATTSIIKTITEVLSAEVGLLLKSLAEMIVSYKEGKKTNHKTAEEIEKNDAVLETMLSQSSDMLNALHIILELLTNLCACEDGADKWDNLSSSDTSDDITDVSMDGEETDEFHKFLNIPCELHEAIVSQSLLQKILSFAAGPAEEISTVLQSFKQSRDFLKRIQGIQYRALLCISNIVQCLDMEDMGGVDAVCQIWMNLARLAFKDTDVNNTQMLEASSSAVRAILQRLLECKANSRMQQVTLDDVQVLINIGRQTSDTRIRINVIRILANLSNLLNKSCDDYSEIIKTIGLYLLEVSSKDAELHVSAEALDAIFDVFAEDDVDPLAQQIQLLERLKNLLSALKGKINLKKKNLGEHFPIVMTAKMNLIRFIKYKTNYYDNR